MHLFLCVTYSTGLPSNTGDLFFLSFMFNLLSCLFREASCGECVYLEDLILFSGRLGLGFGGGTGCRLQCRLRRCGGRCAATARVSVCSLVLLSVCLSPLALCLPPYPRLHCFTDYITPRFPTRADTRQFDRSQRLFRHLRHRREVKKKIESKEHFVFL